MAVSVSILTLVSEPSKSKKFINKPKLYILVTLVDTMIPLALRVKKLAHREVAAAQDLVVGALYEVFNNAVLHGGTSIWRCYGGNRFSEDIDVYIPQERGKIASFFNALLKRGFVIEKKKISESSIFSTLRFDRTVVRFEAIFRNVSGMLKDYETVDGNFITVYTLTPEQIIAEKVDTYLKRLKVRDLYDIFFLLRHVREKDIVKSKIGKLVANFKKPSDEHELKVLLIGGLVPSSEKMIEYIKYWR